MIDLRRRRMLMGVGAASLVSAVLYGLPLEAAPARPVRRAGRGASRDRNEMALVAAVAETIIPATDTPGAIGAGVPDFIAMMYSDWMLPDEQVKFKSGLSEFEAQARQRFGRVFARCTPAQQVELVSAWDTAVMAHPPHPGQPKPPYALFKALTVVGYYTSKVGQEQELKTEMHAGQQVPGGPVMMTIPFKI